MEERLIQRIDDMKADLTQRMDKSAEDRGRTERRLTQRIDTLDASRSKRIKTRQPIRRF